MTTIFGIDCRGLVRTRKRIRVYLTYLSYVDPTGMYPTRTEPARHLRRNLFARNFARLVILVARRVQYTRKYMLMTTFFQASNAFYYTLQSECSDRMTQKRGTRREVS